MVAAMPSIIVMIPTLNEADHIAAVLAQLHEDAAHQLIVADGGSTDGTQQIVTGFAATNPNVRLVHNEGRTQAAAMNMLLHSSFAADIIIRADAHASYPDGFVRDLAASLDAHDAASVVIPMDAVAGPGCFQKGNAWIADSVLGAGGSAHRGGTRSGYIEHGHHAAFTMDSFRNIGGYDTSFKANEDAEYDQRLTQFGGRIWLDADIRIDYFPRAYASSLFKQYFGYGVGRARFCHKHSVRPKLRQLIPLIHVGLLALSILLLPFTALGWLWPVIYLTVITYAGIASAIKNHSLCGLMGTVALAIMHTAWGVGYLVTTTKLAR